MSTELPHQARHLKSGAILCLGIGAFGLLVVAGFFIAAKLRNHPSPVDAPFAVPTEKLRAIVCGINAARFDAVALAKQFREARADILLLQRINTKQLRALAQNWASGQFEPSSAYYPAPNPDDPEVELGNAIVSRFPLYEGRAIPNPMNAACGTWAVCAINGRRFYLASVQFSGNDQPKEWSHLLKAWSAIGSPPIVIGGDLGSAPLAEAFHPIVTGQQALCVSRDWMGTNATESGITCADLGPAR